ncbi:MAG TPA: type IX secretion system membrane protein PorP/SprF, partial [Bacteroidetes bacterium]|nr:type IX secretion system membrane protein PorP/SprF [Bacteroidota bacterium]
GLGATIFSEKTGPISYNGLSAAFAGHIHLNQAWRLSIGASLEILNYRLDPSAITFLEANDVAISSTSTSLILPSMNAGFALYTKGFFLAGATRQLLQNRIQINSQNPYVSGLEVHYLIQSGFRVELSEDFQFTPSLALRFRSPAAPSWELSLRARIKDFFYIGASYRHQDAITGLMGLNINHMLSLYYAYDFTTSTLRKNSAGTHSLVLNLRIEHAASSIRQYFW